MSYENQLFLKVSDDFFLRDLKFDCMLQENKAGLTTVNYIWRLNDSPKTINLKELPFSTIMKEIEKNRLNKDNKEIWLECLPITRDGKLYEKEVVKYDVILIPFELVRFLMDQENK